MPLRNCDNLTDLDEMQGLILLHRNPSPVHQPKRSLRFHLQKKVGTAVPLKASLKVTPCISFLLVHVVEQLPFSLEDSVRQALNEECQGLVLATQRHLNFGGSGFHDLFHHLQGALRYVFAALELDTLPLLEGYMENL